VSGGVIGEDTSHECGVGAIEAAHVRGGESAKFLAIEEPLNASGIYAGLVGVGHGVITHSM
jgi:hypothetical protein